MWAKMKKLKKYINGKIKRKNKQVKKRKGKQIEWTQERKKNGKDEGRNDQANRSK